MEYTGCMVHPPFKSEYTYKTNRIAVFFPERGVCFRLFPGRLPSTLPALPASVQQDGRGDHDGDAHIHLLRYKLAESVGKSLRQFQRFRPVLIGRGIHIQKVGSRGIVEQESFPQFVRG